ncbi:hypothetical protein SAMN05421847_0285 [Halpernia humi]|uniref:Uncharacterized protein n=1 Tax=Halpernia humi TaxID=493375 RepID=A0A1H5SXU3_9FLAO|nr:hypothetical protein SAMN05421847_0285 [Halpernia humi]
MVLFYPKFLIISKISLNIDFVLEFSMSSRFFGKFK